MPRLTEASTEEDTDFFASLLPDGGDDPQNGEPESPEPREGADKGPEGEGEAAPEGAEPPRDEHGRFAPRGRGERTEREIPAGEMIPPWRLREEAEKRREEADRRALAEHEAALLRQRLVALEAMVPAQADEPDILVEPERFAQTIEARIQHQFERRFVNSSMGRAHRQYQDEFADAYRTLQRQDEYTRERILAADDPGEALMEWHRAHSVLDQIRSNPDAFRGQIAEQLLADPEFRKRAIETWRGEASGRAGRRSAGAAGLPSLNRATRAARDNIDLEEDDEEFFKRNLRLQR